MALKNCKFAATAGGPGNLQELTDIGYTFISVVADVFALHQYREKQISGF